jgi:hypothetical protein
MSNLSQFVTYFGVTTNDKVTKTWILIQFSFPKLHCTIHILGILCTLCEQCTLCMSRPKMHFVINGHCYLSLACKLSPKCLCIMHIIFYAKYIQAYRKIPCEVQDFGAV